MHGTTGRETTFSLVFTTCELIFNQAVRNVRKNHGNAVVGLLLNIAQTVLLVAVFMVIFIFAGMRGGAIRGDTLIYLMSGVFLFMAHIKVLSAVATAEGPTSTMMKHRPMNSIVSIGGAALAELYIQVLSVVVILFLYHVIWTPVEIYQPAAAFGMLLAVWFAGLAIGVMLYALKPWAPAASKLLTQLFARMNMVASGKFFLANSLPESYLHYFMWNPLFHCIDQARGYAFINYNPMHTSALYPVLFGITVLFLGMLVEAYTRKRASLSWSAKH
ncbi:ABC transporter permease [Roseinatronobacter bogoriensis]|uniref:ABC transporter permease n=1 Tax=Roseinatronobacter bogoriensis subsp. barguzinensis TaxID=441209 RepID=A0A2K8K9T5_9RHOB|nr:MULTISPECIES: ABC transporter permease [Rhodobaca]ATX66212.1 ABC transporter permease [Rhodobaca barguzinensis]MBB4207322.1 ABC-type polysaccharide/polyol phosphate export permease [Rhodobaca bogoriensis DSM 18756]TDW40372.1 ABC-type polysaccharide/polyol phosphate export permease [Rhodobaca barguzinensis]TDY70476.1 ABC-type polysaccharide/polyol phosphate export permease [Rhodobaca bogoriensis DSM 18756]